MRWLLAAMLVLSACTPTKADDGQTRVVATTEIIADLVRQVGGERVHVDSVVPPGADPHSYEPAPADAVKLTKADVTFTNHLLLEEHALIKAIDANAPKGTPNVSLAEAAETYGAHVIPLVEDLGLDVIWLGLAVRGDGRAQGATRASDVKLRASKVEGPGSLIVYLTGALGDPEVLFNSADGLTDADVVVLPPAAHTHLNWAFTKPGLYRLTLAAQLADKPVGEGVFTFAVGVDPHTAGKPTVLGKGHTDLAIDLDKGQVYAFTDVVRGQKQDAIPPDQVVIEVPSRALETIPSDARFAFLGSPGTQIHQLPQAVLGKHVHGEIDPHLWQDVRNAKAYVQLIRDTLAKADPAGADRYAANARTYLAELDVLDSYVREQIARIPAGRRQLVTTHDAFGYLAQAYDMTVAGFVVPNPAQEPSVEQVRKLTETIRNLRVPAVFVEPNLAHRAGVLSQVASDQKVRVCKLYGDSFDENARSYVAMMRHNADELLACLGNAGGIGGGEVVIEDGHVDIGPRFVNGQWRIQIRHDSGDPPAWREVDEVVLKAGDSARMQVPTDSRFDFLGTPGNAVWLLPQVQRPGVLWPGWNTQDPQVAAEVKREVRWRWHSVTGPGRALLFLNGAFGEPQQLFDSQKLPQESSVEVNTHVHGNWAFTAEGSYRIDMELSATLQDGRSVTDRRTLRIQVGQAQAPPTLQAATPGRPQPPEAGGPPSAIWLVAMVPLLALIGWLLLRRRRS